jgi:hypothetical protein
MADRMRRWATAGVLAGALAVGRGVGMAADPSGGAAGELARFLPADWNRNSCTRAIG